MSIARVEDFAAARTILDKSHPLDRDILAERRHARNLMAWFTDLMGGTAAQTYTGAGVEMCSVALSPDGRFLAAAGAKGIVLMFDLKSGDLLEIELLLESKNDYDYLAFEDMKPAGCEPVAVRSGYTYGELCSNMELRDEKVVFFIGWLNQGKHLLKYRMRAEIPGRFHALPTKGFAMYAPELKCNSDEITLKIED